MGDSTKDRCRECDELEYGDNLYLYGEDDVGIVFSKISNIKFCPMCGKKLLTYREKRERH